MACGASFHFVNDAIDAKSLQEERGMGRSSGRSTATSLTEALADKIAGGTLRFAFEGRFVRAGPLSPN